jgi:hypothetical protein
MFGFGRLGRGGGLRRALMAGAGMMAWRWWKNREANRDRAGEPVRREPRQTYDTGRTNPGGGTL